MSLLHSLECTFAKNAYVITSIMCSLQSISNILERVIHSCKNDDDDDEGDEARARQETRGYLSSVSAVSPRGPSLL